MKTAVLISALFLFFTELNQKEEMHCNVCSNVLIPEETVFIWDDLANYRNKQYVSDRVKRYKDSAEDILYNFLKEQEILFFCSDSCADIKITEIGPLYDSIYGWNEPVDEKISKAKD